MMFPTALHVRTLFVPSRGTEKSYVSTVYQKTTNRLNKAFFRPSKDYGLAIVGLTDFVTTTRLFLDYSQTNSHPFPHFVFY